MAAYVLPFEEIDHTQAAVAGGKGANLGELSRLDGIRVPPGFCVTTDAFRRTLAGAPSIDANLQRLSRVSPADGDAIRTLGSEIRRTIEAVTIPEEVAAAITAAVASLGRTDAYAVRSSATAEDLPAASFAGQQDTYLNVVGTGAVLAHVSRCWASLFNERAVSYRMRNRFDHRKVLMAVVVQRMVVPDAAGTMFTADPVTSNRKVVAIEAGFGLGEALVSGLVNPDVFKVREGRIVARTLGAKQLAIRAVTGGGTEQQAVDVRVQRQPALSDAQVMRLERLGRRIEAHFGRPQDIEWCLAGDDFYIVQSRPITTLFPVPAAGDGENHVFLSVGHQQMMTDAMKPLGLSMWQLTAARQMLEAGGRLFVDATQILASPRSRAAFLEMAGRADPLMRDALMTIMERGDFVREVPDEVPAAPSPAAQPPIEPDAAVVVELIERTQASIAALKREIRAKTGQALFDFIIEDIRELRRILFDPRSHQVFMSAMEATWWLNEHVKEWLGDENAADVLTQSVPNNVTSEMGLALLDVADAIRPHPAVVAFLEGVKDEEFLDELVEIDGGKEARDAIQGFLDRYGMRCVGEIDITKPRWSERPTTLLPIILGNVKNLEAGAGERHFERGLREAQQKEEDLLRRLRAKPGGRRKAEEVKRRIDLVRTFIGYREYPKFGMVSRYFIYKLAMLDEAEILVRAGVLRDKDDVFYLTYQELAEVVRTHQADQPLIRRRKDEFRWHEVLTPPRVLTSDGEAIAGAYRRDDLPAGALPGLAVSTGSAEGRARIVLDMAGADLEAGDILVTTYTDPSWTPLFVSIKGLVTEVGGHMTHGAVIAREYGLPAVVGVQQATRLIQDGQRIRVNGTDGYVEVMP